MALRPSGISGSLRAGALFLCGLCLVALTPAGAYAQAPTSPPTPAEAPIRWSFTNMTRVESWSFFDPPPSGGDPNYTFVANRLSLGAAAAWRRADVSAAVQYVQFGGLPPGAFGPGALGTGALYFDHSGRTDSRGLYLRTLAARVRLPAGISVQAGRFAYQSGAESSSGIPKIEAVKRARIDGRLVGEFEWSLYERTFDGLRADMDRRAWHLSGAWFSPTQGGFEDDAGARLGDVDIAAATLALRPSVAVPSTDLNFFALRYADDRPVTTRPDNTALPAEHAAIRLTTIGAAGIGSTVAGRGEFDWLAWFAGQAGSWYGQRHRAWSLAVEGGYQWKTPWQPWVRAGVLYASGDDDSGDAAHRTFFQMLPTVRKYAYTAAYAPMNLRDTFIEVIARPTSRVLVRADARQLRLAQAADLWYAGSGATQRQGRFFGYAGRRSGGATALGTVFEGAADVTLGRHWTINGFAGTIHGGQVVRSLFAGDWLRFVYLEAVIRF